MNADALLGAVFNFSFFEAISFFSIYHIFVPISILWVSFVNSIFSRWSFFKLAISLSKLIWPSVSILIYAYEEINFSATTTLFWLPFNPPNLFWNTITKFINSLFYKDNSILRVDFDFFLRCQSTLIYNSRFYEGNSILRVYCEIFLQSQSTLVFVSRFHETNLTLRVCFEILLRRNLLSVCDFCFFKTNLTLRVYFKF